jgi:hypothetical protein
MYDFICRLAVRGAWCTEDRNLLVVAMQIMKEDIE